MVFCNNVYLTRLNKLGVSHNPYFNRWFSAIFDVVFEGNEPKKVTILILIDGFLQYICVLMNMEAL